MSTGDFVPALEGFFGSAAGLSASTINRLTTTWQAEHREFVERDLSETEYVYVWVDGIRTKVRLPGASAPVLPGRGGYSPRRDQGARRDL
jgi:putative transposase